MKLSELTVAEFCAQVASDAPAPGGGACAALCGAVGTALTIMVACLTQGREKYAVAAPVAAQVHRRCDELRLCLQDAMNRDTEVFRVFSAALALPKETAEQKAARADAMQTAMQDCTEVPMRMMELMAEAVSLVDTLAATEYNKTASSDLGLAYTFLQSGLRGAWLNVLINIRSLKDAELAADYRRRGEEILERVLPLTEKGFAAVTHEIEG